MISLFDTDVVKFENPDYTFEVRSDGCTYTHKKKGVLEINFDDVLTIHHTRYCNSNNNYMLMFTSVDPLKKSIDITLDTNPYYEGHNIRETKTLLVAFAAHKLGKEFPNNIGSLDVTLGHSLKEKQIKLRGNKIVGAKHEVDIDQIKRVVCAATGSINNFAIYTSETKKGFFDKPDMSVPINSITAHLLEAIVTKNTGHGIDFSHGNSWDQKNSDYIIIRFMDPGFFLTDIGNFKEPGVYLTDVENFKEDWQKVAFERVIPFGYYIDGTM